MLVQNSKEIKSITKENKKLKLDLNKTIKKKPFKFHRQNIFLLLLFKKKQYVRFWLY